jgi:hypothetical protein
MLYEIFTVMCWNISYGRCGWFYDVQYLNLRNPWTHYGNRECLYILYLLLFHGSNVDANALLCFFLISFKTSQFVYPFFKIIMY